MRVGMFRKWDPLSVKQENNFRINIDRARSEKTEKALGKIGKLYRNWEKMVTPLESPNKGAKYPRLFAAAGHLTMQGE